MDAGWFTVHVPSESAPETGIKVRVFHPSTVAIRYPEGAPVGVFVSGGHNPGSLPAEGTGSITYYEASTYGYVLMHFLMPGGTALDGTSSGGTYDYRGPSFQCVVTHSTGYQADSMIQFMEHLHALDPPGKRSMTVSEIVEAGVLPEKEIKP